MAEMIKLSGVNKSYGAGELKTRVLFDIDLSFEEGGFNSIIGASGSGKTTLLNIIGTLDRADSGQVWIDGKRADLLTRNQLAQLRNGTLGFVFQFHYLLSEFSAYENVVMPSLIAGKGADGAAKERARELLELVGIGPQADKLATRMSGGQQQRAAIARALMNRPRIILADEPTGNLDSDTSDSIYKLFRKINEQTKTTFIIITHDRRIAERTDRIVEISDGRIKMDIKR
jgi:lipoprotein-releasing system ATP-binding protein